MSTGQSGSEPFWLTGPEHLLLSPVVPRLLVRLMLIWSKMPASDRLLCSPGLRTVTRGKGDLHTDFPHAAMKTKIQREENEHLSILRDILDLACGSTDVGGDGFCGWFTGEPWHRGHLWESALLAHGPHSYADGVCGRQMNVTLPPFRGQAC